MFLTPTTELEAVNILLASIGQTPINTVENSGDVDTVMARSALHNASRTVQTKGWHWNIEPGLVLSLSFPDGEIKVPKNTLRVFPSQADRHLDIVLRGERLYNRQTHSFNFTHSVTVDLIVFLKFAELPEAARQYITAVAGKQYQLSKLGSELQFRFSKLEEDQALATLLDTEAITENYNVLPAFYNQGGVLAR